jgi:hypothetical protein
LSRTKYLCRCSGIDLRRRDLFELIAGVEEESPVTECDVLRKHHRESFRVGQRALVGGARPGRSTRASSSALAVAAWRAKPPSITSIILLADAAPCDSPLLTVAPKTDEAGFAGVDGVGERPAPPAPVWTSAW